MSSTFYGLQIARTGIFVSQKGLEVTGHNIANANTAGYTRQRLITSSIEASINSGIFTYASKGQVGGGVEIQELSQIRDAFLDMQYRRENSSLGEWTVKTDALQYIEDIFNEPSDSGLNAVLADFFDDIQELTKNPESKEIRTLLRQDAIKLTETLHYYYDQMVSLQKEQDTAIELTVHEINEIVRNIRDLNDMIFKYEAGGETANDLRDKRNLLVDQLSNLIEIDYYETPSGRFRIDVNGIPLVDHLQYRTLEVEKKKENSIQGEDSLYSIEWAGTDIEVAIRGGKLKGYIDMRDGNSVDNVGIPYFVDQLNTFARALFKRFNEIHVEGYGLTKDADGNFKTGMLFFNCENMNIDGSIFDDGNESDLEEVLGQVTAKNITLSQDILDDVYNIAAAMIPTGNNPNDTDVWGNNENALRLAALRDEDNIEFTYSVGNEKVTKTIGGFEDFVKEVIAELAVESSYSNQMKENQDVLTYNLDNQRLSISGVSIDEEMTNMIQYQHAYSAAARIITAIDEALDVLINRTGVVGR